MAEAEVREFPVVILTPGVAGRSRPLSVGVVR
jgi:hypothetical protein